MNTSHQASLPSFIENQVSDSYHHPAPASFPSDLGCHPRADKREQLKEFKELAKVTESEKRTQNLGLDLCMFG